MSRSQQHDQEETHAVDATSVAPGPVSSSQLAIWPVIPAIPTPAEKRILPFHTWPGSLAEGADVYVFQP